MDIIECREKLSSLETTLDMVRQAERNIMTAIKALRKEELITERQGRVCWFCGSSDYYALGLCQTCYTRARQHGGDPAYRRPKKLPLPSTPPYDWRVRLRNDVLGADAAKVIAPSDLEATTDFVLSSLRGRERDVVIARYRDMATLQEIGDQNGFTRERARQIIAKSLRRLRIPTVRQCLLVGITEAKRLEEEKAETVKLEAEEKAETVKLEAEEKAKERDEAAKRAIACGHVSIDYLDLSVRAYNALYRSFGAETEWKNNGPPTIAHYLNLRHSLGEERFYAYLMSVWHMGRKSADNVIDCLDRWQQKHGFQNEEDGACG